VGLGNTIKGGGVFEEVFERDAAGADDERGGVGVFFFEGGEAWDFSGASAFDFDGNEAGAVGEDEVGFEIAVAPVVELRSGGGMGLQEDRADGVFDEAAAPDGVGIGFFEGARDAGCDEGVVLGAGWWRGRRSRRSGDWRRGGPRR